MYENPEDLHRHFQLPIHPHDGRDRRVRNLLRPAKLHGRGTGVSHDVPFSQRPRVGPEFRVLLDILEQAIFGLNRDGYVVLTNHKADLIAAAGDGLWIDAGRLVARSEFHNAALGSFIRCGVEAGETAPGHQHMNLPRISQAPESAALHLTRLPVRAGAVMDRGQVDLFVMVTDLDSESQSRATPLCRLFSLSPTEGRVADLLLQGLNIGVIANRLKVTEGTARGYVKSILAKTGTRRQSELMRLMLSLPGSRQGDNEAPERLSRFA